MGDGKEVFQKKYMQTLQHRCLPPRRDDRTAVSIADSKMRREGCIEQRAWFGTERFLTHRFLTKLAGGPATPCHCGSLQAKPAREGDWHPHCVRSQGPEPERPLKLRCRRVRNMGVEAPTFPERPPRASSVELVHFRILAAMGRAPRTTSLPPQVPLQRARGPQARAVLTAPFRQSQGSAALAPWRPGLCSGGRQVKVRGGANPQALTCHFSPPPRVSHLSGGAGACGGEGGGPTFSRKLDLGRLGGKHLLRPAAARGIVQERDGGHHAQHPPRVRPGCGGEAAGKATRLSSSPRGRHRDPQRGRGCWAGAAGWGGLLLAISPGGCAASGETWTEGAGDRGQTRPPHGDSGQGP